MNKLVNGWLRERSKMEDPDSQKSIDILNHYNALWCNYCHKNLAKPKDFLHEFIDICDREDKRIRKAVADIAVKEINQKQEEVKI